MKLLPDVWPGKDTLGLTKLKTALLRFSYFMLVKIYNLLLSARKKFTCAIDNYIMICIPEVWHGKDTNKVLLARFGY